MNAKQFSDMQKSLGLTDLALGEQLGVHRTRVWKWRTGRTPVDSITELAMLFLVVIQPDKTVKWRFK